MFNFLKPKIKTDKELQDELRALCDKVIVDQYWSIYEAERYEKLLREIYSRNLTPVTKLIPRK
jgi:uncharacterized protein YdiU (UPF0061 family)